MTISKTNKQAILFAFTFWIFFHDAINAFGDSGAPASNEHLRLNLWAFGVGLLAPCVGYFLNHVGSWLTEPAKGVVQFVVATVAGALTQLVVQGTVGFDAATLDYVVSALIAAFAAHHAIWKPAEVNLKLGATKNRRKR